MARLGILQGNAPMQYVVPRGFGPTLASSRARRSIGPQFLGASNQEAAVAVAAAGTQSALQASANASKGAGAAAAKAAAYRAAQLAQQAAKDAAQAQAQALANQAKADADAKAKAKAQTAAVTVAQANQATQATQVQATQAQSGAAAQEALRVNYDTVAPVQTPASNVPTSLPATVTEEDLRHIQPGSVTSEAATTAPKSLFIPIAALVAAYFVIKG